MSPRVYKSAKVRFYMNQKQGDGRKEHDPEHLHVIYQDNEFTFPIDKVKKLSNSDFERKRGRLLNNMKEWSQYVLDNFQPRLMYMWETQNISEIKD